MVAPSVSDIASNANARRRDSVESYAHKAAKAAVVEWLRSAAEEAGLANYAQCAELSWRVNRPGPFWGVWEEYPVSGERGVSSVWDELGWMDRPNPVPTYNELLGLGVAPDVIFDIAVQHKGNISMAFEIVHKHGITDKKRQILRALDCETFVIDAAWVLSQVRRPDRLVVTEYFSGGRFSSPFAQFERL